MKDDWADVESAGETRDIRNIDKPIRDATIDITNGTCLNDTSLSTLARYQGSLRIHLRAPTLAIVHQIPLLTHLRLVFVIPLDY